MKKSILLLLFAGLLSVTALQAQFSLQKAVLEVFTGSWSQYSTDAIVKLDSALIGHNFAFPVNVHTSDSMATPEGTDLDLFYSALYPIMNINRSGSLKSRTLWSSSVSSVLAGAASVTVEFDSVQYNTGSRQLDVYITALFTGTVTGDLRFNCVVVEDSVVGSGAGYDQANYYNTIPGHTYYGAGDPVVGLPHRYVARAYLGGTWGTSGIIPSSVVFGQTFTQHYTYTVPAGFNPAMISLVGMVSFYNGNNPADRAILNAERWPHITNPVALQVPALTSESFSMYPNPVADCLMLHSTAEGPMSIVNQLGETVLTRFLTRGNNQITFHLPSGTYWVMFNSAVKKLMVTE